MNLAYLTGFVWIIIAGLIQGAFPLPMKYTRVWKWEHIWFWYSIISLFFLPLVLAFVTVPKLAAVYSESPLESLLLTALFGMGWGVGSVCFGLGVDALGMSLGFPLMAGLFTSLGALIPLFVLTPDLVFARVGLLIIAGNIVAILGVIVCSLAGRERERRLGGQAGSRIGQTRSFGVGLTICIFGGVLSSLFNFGYAFGSKIVDAAVRVGASRDNALNAMWLIELSAGGVINAGYCVRLFQKNASWSPVWRATWVDWSGAWTMGLLWTGSVIVYGWGANYLGRLGASLGWALWNITMVLTPIVLGLLTGEWEGAHGKPLRLLFFGFTLLVASLIILGMAA